MSSTPSTSSARNGARRKGLVWVTAVVLAAGAAGIAWWALVLRHAESTDNAYVQGHVVQITPQVAGTVVAVLVEDTDAVRAGQPLVRLDAADARVALEQAEAQLAEAVRAARSLFANETPLRALVSQRETEVARAATDVARAEEDVQRRTPLVQTGAIGREEYEHARAQLAAARAALATAQSGVASAREQFAAHRVQTEGLAPERHPAVQRAAARVREAWLALARCEITAPVAGTVARRSVQLGQRVAAGAPLMSVVGLGTLWVDANFKEGQLGRLRIGQPATLVADVYGTRVKFRGTVAGLGAGTGAAFALLPAQNATGNWIKIVQRVPVRIALDAAELKAHPLRVGLSMHVTVDVRDGEAAAAPVASVASAAPPASAASSTPSTAADDAIEHAAGERVQQIIARHLGRAAASAATPRREP
ncbi:MAG: efflux RND transporter periplasmic adaptor subunit [Rubrivivax sp.]|nr:efflux RND transporter periplasmic adaptor subunit [Rubrivivax sp.]